MKNKLIGRKVCSSIIQLMLTRKYRRLNNPHTIKKHNKLTIPNVIHLCLLIWIFLPVTLNLFFFIWRIVNKTIYPLTKLKIIPYNNKNIIFKGLTFLQKKNNTINKIPTASIEYCTTCRIIHVKGKSLTLGVRKLKTRLFSILIKIVGAR